MKKVFGVLAAVLILCVLALQFCDLHRFLPMEEVVEEDRRGNMLEALGEAFRNRGVDVDFNSETGEMNLNAAVLFGGDSAELSDAQIEKLYKAHQK